MQTVDTSIAWVGTALTGIFSHIYVTDQTAPTNHKQCALMEKYGWLMYNISAACVNVVY